MSKSVFLSLPSHGHINATLPVVGELVRRGEKLDYWSTADFATRIEHTGARFRNYAQLSNRPLDNLIGEPLPMAATLAETTRALLPALLDRLEETPPDYLIHDSACLWGKYAARITDLPAICTVTTFALEPTSMTTGDGPSDFRSLATFGRAMQEINERYGLRGIDLPDVFANKERLNLVFTSRDFQPRDKAFGDEFRFVGPCIGRRIEDTDDQLERVLKDKPVYISMGTIFNRTPELYRLCFEALGDEGRPVVLSLGGAELPSQIGPPPTNFLVRRFVPQLRVMKRAAVFVSHGGMNGTNEALYYGVPLVLIPQALDQFMVAARVEELGAGVRLDLNGLSSFGLREAIARISGESDYAQSAAAIAGSLRAAGGFRRAADEIQTFTAPGR